MSDNYDSDESMCYDSDESMCYDGCACIDCDRSDPTNWGYNLKGDYVKYESDSDFEQDDYGNMVLREERYEEIYGKYRTITSLSDEKMYSTLYPKIITLLMIHPTIFENIELLTLLTNPTH